MPQQEFLPAFVNRQPDWNIYISVRSIRQGQRGRLGPVRIGGNHVIEMTAVVIPILCFGIDIQAIERASLQQIPGNINRLAILQRISPINNLKIAIFIQLSQSPVKNLTCRRVIKGKHSVLASQDGFRSGELDRDFPIGGMGSARYRDMQFSRNGIFSINAIGCVNCIDTSILGINLEFGMLRIIVPVGSIIIPSRFINTPTTPMLEAFCCCIKCQEDTVPRHGILRQQLDRRRGQARVADNNAPIFPIYHYARIKPVAAVSSKGKFDTRATIRNCDRIAPGTARRYIQSEIVRHPILTD